MLAVLLAALLTAALPAAAQDHDQDLFAHPADPAQLRQLLGRSADRIQAAPAIQGRFEQRRYLSELPQPLLSTGEFLFAREYGVWWHTRTPFESVFVLTRDGIRNRDEGGAEMRLSAADQPGIAAVARIFFSLFALDLKALSSDFETFGQGRPEDWQIGLRPRLAALSAVFRDARLNGGEQVHDITLVDAHGDRTVITLSDVEISAKGLTAEQRSRFAR